MVAGIDNDRPRYDDDHRPATAPLLRPHVEVDSATVSEGHCAVETSRTRANNCRSPLNYDVILQSTFRVSVRSIRATIGADRHAERWRPGPRLLYSKHGQLQ